MKSYPALQQSGRNIAEEFMLVYACSCQLPVVGQATQAPFIHLGVFYGKTQWATHRYKNHHRQTSCSDTVCFPYTQFTSSLQVYVSLPAGDKLRLSVVLEIIPALKWCLWLKRLFCRIDFLLLPSYYEAENSYVAIFNSLLPLGFTWSLTFSLANVRIF